MDFLLAPIKNAIEHIGDNQFATGGLLLGLGGIIVAYLRNLPSQLFQKLLRLISIEVTIRKPNDLFSHLNDFFATRRPSKYTRNFRASYSNRDTLEESIKISLGEGTHIFWHTGILMICKRIWQKEQQNAQDSESFHIRLFTRKQSRLKEFLMEAVQTSEPEYDNIKVYQSNAWFDDWNLVRRAKYRDPSNIILKEGLFDSLVKEIENFYKSEEWFTKIGIPWKRGYLFYGPPGNGKTSTILCLASHLKMPVYIIHKLNETSIDKLTSLMSELPQKAFVVFEDIDAMLKKRPNKKEVENDDSEDISDDLIKGSETKEDDKINFAGLLNALDGITTPEGHIIFMTTNHPQTLDAALVRPGRIDRRVEFSNPGAEESVKIFKKFYPGATQEILENFSGLISRQNLSASAIQEMLYRNGSPEKVLEELENGTN